MLKLDRKTKLQLINVAKDNNIYLEGNILKLIDVDDKDKEFKMYISKAIEDDKNTRQKRLEVTKQVQSQNKDLIMAQKSNEDLVKNLNEALREVENAKKVVENDLDVLQKKTQNELITNIIRITLWIIVGVGFTTTMLYTIALLTGRDTQILESAWINIFGILLTNSFSIIGTIMGVKYSNQNK
jgi:hypothetical protein